MFEEDHGERGVGAVARQRGVDVDDLLSIVELWDPLKQRTATQSLVYYARHVEKNSVLSDRLEAFLKEAAEAAAPQPPTADPEPRSARKRGGES